MESKPMFYFLEKYQELIAIFEEKSGIQYRTVINYEEQPELLRLEDVVDYLVYGTNISQIPPFTTYFHFLKDVQVFYDVNVFACNPTYSFNYAINKNDEY